MKLTEPWEHQRLCVLLDRATSREQHMWRGYTPKRASSQDTDVSPAQRDEAVRWLTEIHEKLRLYPETLVLAVNILDRFLSAIKARPKYLRCIAIACFFLAAKTCEEDECVPSLKRLTSCSGCGCSPSDVRRMEKIVLDKLNWELYTATALDFLHMFHAMAVSCRSQDSVLFQKRSERLGALTHRLFRCLSDHSLMQLRGSMLALALVTLELETCSPDWLALTIELLRKTQLDSSELIRSRELVSRSLSTLKSPCLTNTVYIYQPCPPPPGRALTHLSTDQAPAALCAQPQSSAAGEEHTHLPPSSSSSIRALLSPNKLLTVRCKNSAKRKVDDMEVDDFFADIKRLYNEEATPCPPLQPISAP